jgi:Rrf2 family protein
MRLSQGVEWGLHCVLFLARSPAGEMVSRRSFARHYDLPEMYLAKCLQALSRSGILQATTGPRGGFRLARNPDAITVLDVVEAVEGTAPPFMCQEIRQRVPDRLPAQAYCAPCRFKTVMLEADEAWRNSLRQVTIEDIARDQP